MKLHEMKKGQSGQIQSIIGNTPVVQRLYEMGVIPGSLVRVMHFAPLGGPMSIRIQNTQLALRKSEAQLIEILPSWTKSHLDVCNKM